MARTVDRSGCTALCDPEAPCPHSECLCCNGTPGDYCTCHFNEGEATSLHWTKIELPRHDRIHRARDERGEG